MRRAFSLFEALVAAALLAVIGLAVIGALSQSAREARTTSDYSLALFMSQKVVEELIQETYENPHAGETLRALDGARVGVDSPFNPFFAALDDIAPPYGRIDVGPDLGVDARAPVMHRLYREFDLVTTASPAPVASLPGQPQILEELGVGYRWPGLKAEERRFDLPLTLVKPHVAPLAPPALVHDLPGMDVAIRSALYSTTPGNQDLTAFVAGFGGDLAAVRDVGAVVVVTSLAVSLGAVMGTHITTGEAALPPGGADDPDARVAVARLYESRAAAAWQALLHARDPGGRMSTSLTAAQLGGSARVAPNALFLRLSEAIRLRATFDFDTARALEHYLAARRLLRPLVTRPYWQYTLDRKILELAKLRVMYAETDDVQFVNAWIDELLGLYRGRNRAVTAFLAREKAACTGLAGVQAMHPTIAARVADLKASETALRQLQARVQAEFFR